MLLHCCMGQQQDVLIIDEGVVAFLAIWARSSRLWVHDDGDVVASGFSPSMSLLLSLQGVQGGGGEDEIFQDTSQQSQVTS
jgi:hypothetical protein